MNIDDYSRQQREDDLVRLQTQKLQREQSQFHIRPSNGQGDKALAALIGLLFAAIVGLFIFAIKRPKTFLVFLVLGYGTLQFFAPVQGAEFNRWVFTLCTNPSKARDELLTTVGNLNSVSSTVVSPADDNSTVSTPSNYSESVPTSTPATAVPNPASAAVNSMCSQFSWSKPDDVPYLKYYKCPHPTTGN